MLNKKSVYMEMLSCPKMKYINVNFFVIGLSTDIGDKGWIYRVHSPIVPSSKFYASY